MCSAWKSIRHSFQSFSAVEIIHLSEPLVSFMWDPHKIRHPNHPLRGSVVTDLGFSTPWSPLSHINFAFSFLFSQPHTPRAMNSSPVKTEDDYFIVREWFSFSISQIGAGTGTQTSEDQHRDLSQVSPHQAPFSQNQKAMYFQRSLKWSSWLESFFSAPSLWEPRYIYL